MEGDIPLHGPFGDSLLVDAVSLDGGQPLGGKSGKTRVIGELKRTKESKVSKWVNLIVKNVWNNWDPYILESLSLDENTPDKKLKRSPARKYYDRWLYLKDHVIPTAGSMRIVDEDTIAMGDMTANGGEFFGFHKYLALKEEVEEHDQYPNREHTSMEKKFLNINKEDIKAEIARVHDLVWESGMRMPYDDPFDILVMPDSTFKVLVLDLSTLRDIEPGKKTDATKTAERHQLMNVLELVYKNLEYVNEPLPL